MTFIEFCLGFAYFTILLYCFLLSFEGFREYIYEIANIAIIEPLKKSKSINLTEASVSVILGIIFSFFSIIGFAFVVFLLIDYICSKIKG